MKRTIPIIYLILAIVLSACGPQQPATPAPTEPVIIQPTEKTLPTIDTPSPEPTAIPTAEPQPETILPELTAPTELPLLDAAGTVELHDLIVFTSRRGLPFAFPGGENDGGLTRRGQVGYSALWAVSPDGKRAGRISPDDSDTAIALAQDGKLRVATTGFAIHHPDVVMVALPDVCQGAETVFLPCDNLNFSPDGQLLAFRYGEDVCGRSLRVINTQTGETLLDEQGRIHEFSFLDNGKIAISAGHCEGSFLSFFDPLSKETTAGGAAGDTVWNADGSVMTVSAMDYTGSVRELWVYLPASDSVMQTETNTDGRNDLGDNVQFMPDGKRFIYQFLSYAVDVNSMTATIDSPAQIVRFDPFSGERTVLVSDPAFHYRLCQYDNESPCAPVWFGDWIQAQRIPFDAIETTFPLEEPSEVTLTCLFERAYCPAEWETVAVNAETGEVRPWNASALPQPAAPTATPLPGTALQSRAVYTSPDGAYAFFLSQDGKSLWLKPKAGEPVLWVREGEGFFYLK